MVAGDKRRKVEDTNPITIEYLYNVLVGIAEPRDSCLIALLYLSGRRVNEILHLQKQDFRIEANRVSFDTFNEKVYRAHPMKDFQIQRNVIFKKSLRDAQHKIIYPKKYEYFPTTIYYQRIRPHWRIDTPSGLAFTQFVTERVGSLPEKTDFVFSRRKGKGHIHYQMAYRIVRYYLPDMWPHLLRHERFTEVAKVYQDKPLETHRFTFHKRFESTLQYIRDLEEELI